MQKVSSTLPNKSVFLIQPQKSESLERRLTAAVQDKEVHFEAFNHLEQIDRQKMEEPGSIFIIGNDVTEPIQLAQRLYMRQKKSKIILLSKSEKLPSLKKIVRFSPFVGMDITCVDETRDADLEQELHEFVNISRQEEYYQDILTKSNSELTLNLSPQKSYFSPNFIEKLMSTAPFGVAVVKRNGCIFGWNKKAASIFKTPETGALDLPVWRFFEEPEADRLKTFIEDRFQEISEKTTSISLERTDFRSKIQILDLSATPFTYSQEFEQALILVFRDITRNVELLHQLKTEVTARDNFLSMASHELRTPLTAMRLHLEMARKRTDPTQPGADDFLKLNEKSLQQVNRLNKLIEDFFDVARVQAGKLFFNLEQFNLSEFVEHYVEENKHLFSETENDFELNLESDVTGVWDKDRIEQALAHLINNALKYAPGTPVEIGLNTEGGYAYLSVSDRGPGISEEEQDKIFEQFERVTPSKTISGLGIGLYITKRIVEGHDGEIQIDSTPGKGSTFTLKLPLNIDPEKQKEQWGVSW